MEKVDNFTMVMQGRAQEFSQRGVRKYGLSRDLKAIFLEKFESCIIPTYYIKAALA